MPEECIHSANTLFGKTQRFTAFGREAIPFVAPQTP
jgi:hypothetical protein